MAKLWLISAVLPQIYSIFVYLFHFCFINAASKLKYFAVKSRK